MHYIPMGILEAKESLEGLAPDIYAAREIDNKHCIINKDLRVICTMSDSSGEAKRLAEFFSISPDLVENLLEHIRDYQRIINSQSRTIDDLNEKGKLDISHRLNREIDRLREALNKAEFAKEQLIKETKYLRGKLSKSCA